MRSWFKVVSLSVGVCGVVDAATDNTNIFNAFLHFTNPETKLTGRLSHYSSTQNRQYL